MKEENSSTSICVSGREEVTQTAEGRGVRRVGVGSGSPSGFSWSSRGQAYTWRSVHSCPRLQ